MKLFVSGMLLLLLALTSIPGAIPANHDRFLSVDDEYVVKYPIGSPAVTDCADVQPFFVALQNSRVDVVGIGDSNQGFGGYGWDHGWQYALSSRFPMYSTGLLTQNENNGNGAGLGYFYSRTSSGLLGVASGAPGVFDRYFNFGTTSTPLSPHRYMYLGSGVVSSFALQGLSLQSSIPLNVSGPLRFHLSYGFFESGNGSFRPVVRRESDSNYTVLVRAPTSVSTQGVEGTLQDYYLDLPAYPRNYTLGFRYVGTGEPDLQAPFFGLYLRAENLDRQNGFSFSTLNFGGGYSARDMAEALYQADNETLSQFFREVRALQGSEKKVLIRINSGLNDRNENLPSFTQNISPGNSPEAFNDNVHSMITRIKTIWQLNGWNANELFFVISVSHDVPDSSSQTLKNYRSAARQLARSIPQTAAVDLAQLVPAWRMQAYNFYASPSDFNHLKKEGYEYLSNVELGALTSCPSWNY